MQLVPSLLPTGTIDPVLGTVGPAATIKTLLFSIIFVQY